MTRSLSTRWCERRPTGPGPVRGATLVEAQTYRYYAHTSDDDDRLYRTREEVDLWRRHDPLAVLKQYLIETRLLSERDEEAMESSIAEELAAAVTEAEAAPEPDDPYSHVYANPIVPEDDLPPGPSRSRRASR